MHLTQTSKVNFCSMSTNAITNRLTSNFGRWAFDGVLLLVIITLANSLIWVLWTSWVEPVILTDELTFALQILEDPSNVLYSNQLHTLVYGSLANSCGPEWYVCSRVLNQVLWAGTGILTFLCCRIFIGSIPSSGFVMIQQLSGLAIFTSASMPEVPYIFLVYLGLFFLALFLSNNQWLAIFVAGMSFGLAALVKPHALILGVFVFLALVVIATRTASLWRSILIFPTGMMIGRLVIGLGIGGPSSINLLGNYFPLFPSLLPVGSRNAGSLFVEQYEFQELPNEASQSLFWEALWSSFPSYLVAAIAIFGAAFALTIYRLGAGDRMRGIDKFVAVVMLAGILMLLFSWLFGAYVSGNGDDHSDRALLRYSEFLVPISVGYVLYEIWREDRASLWTRVTAAALLVAPTLIISSGAVDGLTLFISDSTVFAGYVKFGLVYLLFSAVVSVLLVIHTKSQVVKDIGSGAGLSLFLIMSLLTLDSFASTYREGTLQNSTAQFLETESLDDRSTMYLGVERYRGAAALMISGRLDQMYTRMPSGSIVSSAQLGDQQRLVTMGDFYFDQSLNLVASDAGVHVLEPSRDGGSSVLENLDAPEVSSIDGLGAHAPWGGLATENNVIIRFNGPLQPGNVLKIVVIRHPNASLSDYGLEINGSQFDFNVERVSEPTTVEIALQEQTDAITLKTPLHLSGMNPKTNEPFSLGLGIVSISVE